VEKEPGEQSEKIVLDVRLDEVIHNAAFRGRLSNGHEIVAYIPAWSRGPGGITAKPGDTVLVSLSPFDMSRGEIVARQEVAP
jgi:translation initiation factor IF-1